MKDERGIAQPDEISTETVQPERSAEAMGDRRATNGPTVQPERSAEGAESKAQRARVQIDPPSHTALRVDARLADPSIPALRAYAQGERGTELRASALGERQLRVTEVGDAVSFAALEQAWDALVRRTDDQIFYRHAFLRIWADNFAPRPRRRVLLGWDGDRLRAALPLYERTVRWHGVPLRTLQSTSNAHSCRFDLLADAPEEAAEAFLDYLAEIPTWEALLIRDVPEEGKAWALARAAERRGLLVGTWESLRSPWLPLPDEVSALESRLHSKLKANLRRRARNLAAAGKVTFERIDGGLDLSRALEEGFALEARGWKGKRGTAICQDASTYGFYTELARELSYRAGLALYFLRLNGTPVAFHFGLTHRDAYLLLKPAYDEAHHASSPGQLLTERVMADLITRGTKTFDFLGPDMPWKRDWTDRARVHTWLYVFRDTPRARLIHAAKFRWLPKAREVVGRWRR